jgi:hypothetical protein
MFKWSRNESSCQSAGDTTSKFAGNSAVLFTGQERLSRPLLNAKKPRLSERRVPTNPKLPATVTAVTG